MIFLPGPGCPCFVAQFFDAQNATKIVHIEQVKSALLEGVQGLEFTTIESCAEHQAWYTHILFLVISVAFFQTLFAKQDNVVATSLIWLFS